MIAVLIDQLPGKSRTRERSRDDKRIVDILRLQLGSRSRMRLASAGSQQRKMRPPFFGWGGSAKGRAAAISTSVLANAAHLNFSNSPAFHFPDGRCLVRPRLLRACPFLRPSREKGRGEGRDRDSRRFRNTRGNFTATVRGRSSFECSFFSPFPLALADVSFALVRTVSV